MLVAGIGNLFLGDDGFGPEVVRRLADAPTPGVRVVDYGIRGMHLAYDLLDGLRRAGAGRRAARSGTARARSAVLEVGPGRPGRRRLRRARDEPGGGPRRRSDQLGGTLPPTYVVGCRPPTSRRASASARAVEAAVPGGARDRRHPARPRRCSPDPGGSDDVPRASPDGSSDRSTATPDSSRWSTSRAPPRRSTSACWTSPPEPGEWVLIHMGFAVESSTTPAPGRRCPASS